MLECKFMTNGMAIQYDGVVRPCCTWVVDEDWKKENHYTKITDIENWHNSPQVLEKREMLERGEWPSNCVNCKNAEESGRDDSMRGNGNNAYYNYNEKDITIEIRPGSVCNFACQSCWPDASSRVRHFMDKAGLIDKNEVDTSSITDFKFLSPVSHRVKDIVLLGGEPFYDKNCLKFLEWAADNIDANIMIFTNGLHIDYDFISSYKSKITLILSIDAVGKPADYIRYGSDWNKVKANYFKIKKYEHVELRVNITTSAYNFCYLENLLNFLIEDWPDLVTFGYANEKHLQPNVIPNEKRKNIIKSLETIPKKIWNSTIHEHQQHNTVNAINSIINKLKNDDFNAEQYDYLCSYIKKMDFVKKIQITEHCPELYDILF